MTRRHGQEPNITRNNRFILRHSRGEPSELLSVLADLDPWPRDLDVPNDVHGFRRITGGVAEKVRLCGPGRVISLDHVERYTLWQLCYNVMSNRPEAHPVWRRLHDMLWVETADA